MNIINDKFGLVTPTRCGTRWVWEKLVDALELPFKIATHQFNLSKIQNRKVLILTRNPYTRVRSTFRWFKIINFITLDTTWEEYIMGPAFDFKTKTLHDDYSNKLDYVDKVIKIENVNKEIQDILGITLPIYDNFYFDDELDDKLTLEQAYANPTIVRKVNEKFKKDFIRFNYEKINI